MWEADPSQDLFGDAPAARTREPGAPRSVSAQLTADDLEIDRNLRPQTLD